MARRVRHAVMETRTARDRLKPGAYHFVSLVPGKLALGYRRPKTKKGPGNWVRREYVRTGHYLTTMIGTADDYADPDGINVLNFGQAQALAQGEEAPSKPNGP